MRVSSPPSMCFKLKESLWKPKEQIYNINFYTVSEKWHKTGVKWDNWHVRFDVKCELVALKCKESSYGWWEPGGEAVSPLWWGLAEPSWRLIELLCRTRTLVLRHSVRWSSDRLVGWKQSICELWAGDWVENFKVKTLSRLDGKLWKILKDEVEWECGDCRGTSHVICRVRSGTGATPLPYSPPSTWIDLVNNKD